MTSHSRSPESSPALNQEAASVSLQAIADPVIRRLVQQVVGTLMLALVDPKSTKLPDAPIDLDFLVRVLERAFRQPSLIAAIAFGDIDAGMPWGADERP